MAKKQFLYAAYDTGPSNYGLDVIAYAQKKKNWGVTYLGNNPVFENFSAVYGPDYAYMMVGGPSSFYNSMDNYVFYEGTRLIDETVQVFVLGDSPRSILRLGVKNDVKHATAIVAVPSDVQLALEFGYKDAIWLEGYPSHWGNPLTTKPSDIFRDGEYARFDACTRIFVCGLKHAEITDNMLACVTQAMTQRGGDYSIFFQPHPSEIQETQDQGRRMILLTHPRVTELRTRENVASVMMASDVTVCTGGATAVLEGALLRLRVIYYIDDLVKEYMRKQVNEEIWGPVAAGACLIAGPDQIPFALEDALGHNAGGREFLRARQEAAFPLPPAGLNICQEVCDYIENPTSYVPFSQRPAK